MLTSLEIARLLQKQRKEKSGKQGFDKALLGLGIGLKAQSKKVISK